MLSLNVNIPDPFLRFLDPRLRRVLFIANNSEIKIEAITSKVLSETDVVVQYNNPLFFDDLAQISCHKLHINSSKETDSCWGFTSDGMPERDYLAQEYISLTMAVVGAVPKALVPYFEGLHNSVDHAVITNAVVPLYITLKSDGARSYGYPEGKFPSAGFTSVNYFRFLNWLRYSRNVKRLELYLVGFTGAYNPETSWSGHDFSFEQQIYSTWLDLHRMSGAEGSFLP